MRAWGIAVAKRRGMKRATVAVARKLGVIMHRMWVTGSEFEFGQQQRIIKQQFIRRWCEPIKRF